MKRASKPKPQLRRTFIRDWRNHRGLTQERLVELVTGLGVDSFTASSLSRIENGQQAYTQPILEGIAEALGVSPANLLTAHPTQPTVSSIVDSLAEMPPDEQARVARLIAAYKNPG